MRIRASVGTILVLAVSTLAGLGIWLRESGGPGLQPVPLSNPSPTVASGWVQESLDGEDQNLTSESVDQGARIRRPPSIEGRVLSREGHAISGALLTWTPLLSARGQDAPLLSALDWIAIDDRTTTALSAEDGQFHLARISDEGSPAGSVIWVSHIDYEAKPIVLDYPAGPLVLPDRIELDRSGGLRARVLGPDGKPGVGARVVQTLEPRDVDSQSGTPLDAVCERLLRRVYVTDEHGRVALSPFPGVNRVRAELSMYLSQPWTGRPPAEIELSLEPKFAARGRVHVDPGGEIPEDTVVTSFFRRGARTLALEQSPVGRDGQWGSAALPVLAGDAYLFRLAGGDLVKQEASIAPPRSEEVVTVNFRGERGLDLPVLVLGQGDIELGGAKVQVRWQRDGVWVSSEGFTDVDGRALVRGIPPGVVYPTISCAGYVDQRLDQFELLHPRSDSLVVHLSRGGTIVGRCLKGDEPVSTFDVTWFTNIAWHRSTLRVLDDPEGRFTLTRVPLGEVRITAVSDDFAQGEPQVVFVRPDVPTEVVIRFSDPLLGRGRVVDASSGEPLSDARVQLMTHFRGNKLDKYGSAWPVDHEGKFEVKGLAVGGNPIEIHAHGHATRTVFATGVAGSPVELGLVPLFAKQAVDVHLIGDGTQQDLTRFIGELNGAAYVSDRHFSPDGTLRYEDLDPGQYSVSVVFPGGTTIKDVAFILLPGRDASVRVPVHAATLHVEVLPEPGSEIPNETLFRVTHQVTSGQKACDLYVVPKAGEFDIARVEGSIVAQVETFAGEILGVTRVDVGSGASPTIRVKLDPSPVVFLVVDEDRHPLSGVTVILNCPDDCAGWFLQEASDQEGLCTFQGISLDLVRVNAMKYPEGTMPALLQSLRGSRSTPIEILFAPDCAFRVQLLERGSPCRGVDVQAKSSDRIAVVPPASSDEAGVADFGRVGRAEWRVSVLHPGYWASDHLVNVGDSVGPYPIEIRRLGSVEFVIRTPLGLPAAQVAIDLRSEEMDRWVGDWVASGQVIAPSQGLVTDSGGRLRIDALPNGGFGWRVTTDEGQLEGDVVVPAQSIAQVEVTLP